MVHGCATLAVFRYRRKEEEGVATIRAMRVSRVLDSTDTAEGIRK